MITVLMEGKLYHKTDPTKTLPWELCDDDAYAKKRWIRYATEQGAWREINVPYSIAYIELTSKLKEAEEYTGYSATKIDYPAENYVNWRVEQHYDNQLVIVYTIRGEDIKTRLTIPGLDVKMTDELVTIAINNQIRIEAKRHRFTGLTGRVDIMDREVVKNGPGSEDSAEGPSGGGTNDKPD